MKVVFSKKSEIKVFSAYVLACTRRGTKKGQTCFCKKYQFVLQETFVDYLLLNFVSRNHKHWHDSRGKKR